MLINPLQKEGMCSLLQLLKIIHLFSQFYKSIKLLDLYFTV